MTAIFSSFLDLDCSQLEQTILSPLKTNSLKKKKPKPKLEDADRTRLSCLTVRNGAEKCSASLSDRGSDSGVPGSASCPCLAAALHNPGPGVKVAPFALTSVGCEKTGKLTRSCCSSISSVPPRQAKGSSSAICPAQPPEGFPRGSSSSRSLQQQLCSLPCGCIMDAGSVITVCSHLSGCCF